MPFDQNITYRVNVDDSNFQAKLTQMRASIDSTVGAGYGMGGGMSSPMMFGMMNAMGNFGPMNMGGLADFGSQIRPVTYTPPAIAMQPHFGMFQIQQNLRQAGLAGFGGMYGIGVNAMMDHGIFSQRDILTPQISMSEYIGYSRNVFADRAGQVGAAGAFGALSLGGSLVAGGAGAALGAAPFAGMAGRMVGGLIGGMAGGTLASMYFGEVADRMAGNQAIQSALSAGSFRFYQGPDVDINTGRGFSRRARQDIASSIQNLELQDTRFGAADYQNILESGMQMDMFSGTQNAEDFKRRFKDLVSNVKTVSSTLHTTLKEGMEVIRGFRDMGVTDAGSVNRLTMQSEVFGRMSGRTGMEMLALGQSGAELFRGTGIAMERGFSMAQQNVALVRSMLNTGAISRETVGQAGGENALAQQMTAGALGALQTVSGRGMLMAAFDPRSGSFDTNIMNRGFYGMMGSASANMGNPASFFSFMANQEEALSKLSPMQMQMMSLAPVMRQAQVIAGATGANVRDVAKHLMQTQYGMSHELAKSNLALLTMDTSEYEQQMSLQNQQMVDQMGMEMMREQVGGKAIGNVLTRTFVAPVQRGFTHIGNRVADVADQLMRGVSNKMMGALTGGYQADPGTLGTTSVNAAEKFLQKAAIGAGVGIDVSGSSLLGGDVAGKLISEAGAGSGLLLNYMSESEYEAKLKQGSSMVRLGGEDGRVIAVGAQALKDYAAVKRKFDVSGEDIKKVSIDARTLGLLQGSSGDSIEQAGKVVFGSKFDAGMFRKGDYSEEQIARLKAYALKAGKTQTVKDIENLSSTDSIESVMSVMHSRAGKEIERLEKELVNMDGGYGFAVGGQRQLLTTTAGQAALAELLAGGSKSDFKQQIISAGLMDSAAADRALSAIDKAGLAGPDSKQGQLMRDKLNQIMQLTAAAGKITKETTGSSTTSDTGIVGLSKETTKQMLDMVNVLDQQLKALKSMQEQFKAELMKGK